MLKDVVRLSIVCKVYMRLGDSANEPDAPCCLRIIDQHDYPKTLKAEVRLMLAGSDSLQGRVSAAGTGMPDVVQGMGSCVTLEGANESRFITPEIF